MSTLAAVEGEGRRSRRVDEVDRERVLTAAAKLFRERSFEKTTLKEIALACGMLPGSLHYRWPSKDQLLVDMMRMAMHNLMTVTQEAAMTSDDPVEQARRVLQAHLDMLVTGNDMIYVLLFDWRALRGEAREELIVLRDAYEAQWSFMFKYLRRHGLVRRNIDLHLMRLVAFGAVNWVSTWYHDGGRYTLQQIGDFIWQLTCDAVLTPEARDAYLARKDRDALSSASPSPADGTPAA